MRRIFFGIFFSEVLVGPPYELPGSHHKFKATKLGVLVNETLCIF